MVVMGVPPLEFWILSVFQDVLLTLKVWVVEADPGATLHTDRVHPENVTTEGLYNQNLVLSTSHCHLRAPPIQHAGPAHTDDTQLSIKLCFCLC